jgi:hypothetical protein
MKIIIINDDINSGLKIGQIKDLQTNICIDLIKRNLAKEYVLLSEKEIIPVIEKQIIDKINKPKSKNKKKK